MEYIQLNHSEQIYVKKHMLYSEMEILNIIKRYSTYKKLRKTELNLKNTLRKKIKEVKDEIAVLDKILPKIKNTNPEVDKIKYEHSTKKRSDLETEIEEIRKKLAELQ